MFKYNWLKSKTFFAFYPFFFKGHTHPSNKIVQLYALIDMFSFSVDLHDVLSSIHLKVVNTVMLILKIKKTLTNF